jgi:hypothetical protein
VHHAAAARAPCPAQCWRPAAAVKDRSAAGAGVRDIGPTAGPQHRSLPTVRPQAQAYAYGGYGSERARWGRDNPCLADRNIRGEKGYAVGRQARKDAAPWS